MKPVCTLWDIENLVCMRIKDRKKALVEFAKIAKGFQGFLDVEGYCIHETSAICVKPIPRLERAVEKAAEPYGIQLVQAMAWEAAEDALVNHVKDLLDKDASLFPETAMILSGDGDLLPLVGLLHGYQVHVSVVAWRQYTHFHLKKSADRFIAMEDILKVRSRGVE